MVLADGVGLAAAGVLAVVVAAFVAVGVVPMGVARIAPVRGSRRALSELAAREAGALPKSGTVAMERGGCQWSLNLS